MQKFFARKTPLQILAKRGAISGASIGLSYLLLSSTFGSTHTALSGERLRVAWAIAHAESWWDSIFKRVPKSGGSGSPFCVLWPKPELRSLNTTFSLTPLFIWKNSRIIVNGQAIPKFTAQEVRVFELDSNQEKHLIWQTSVNSERQQIRYGEGTQKTLESGKVYELQISYVDLTPSTKPPAVDKPPKLPTISPIRFTVVAAPAKIKANFSSDAAYFNYLLDEPTPHYGDIFQAAFDPPNPFSDKIRENPACENYPKP
jgi:hypothetical protein